MEEYRFRVRHGFFCCFRLFLLFFQWTNVCVRRAHLLGACVHGTMGVSPVLPLGSCHECADQFKMRLIDDELYTSA